MKIYEKEKISFPERSRNSMFYIGYYKQIKEHGGQYYERNRWVPMFESLKKYSDWLKINNPFDDKPPQNFGYKLKASSGFFIKTLKELEADDINSQQENRPPQVK